MSKEVSSEASKKRKRNDVEGTSTDTNKEETHHVSLFDLSSEIVGNVSNYLSMPDITNLTLVIGCVALRGDKSSRNNNTLYVDAVRAATLQNNSGYLDYVFLGLPEYGLNPNEYHRITDKYVKVADKVRMWMEHNTGWESRVQGAMLSDSWDQEDNPLARKVTVSEEDLDPSPFSDDESPRRLYLSKETNCASLVQERGNLLVSVAGTDVIWSFYPLDQIIEENMEYSTEEEDGIGHYHVELYFMTPRDILLNDPILILKLGLVDVLKVMVEKGFIHSMYVIDTYDDDEYLGFPLLWRAYFHSPDASCFDYLLSRPETDCSLRLEDRTLLHYASSYYQSQDYMAGNRYTIKVTLPIGVAAYRKLTQHSTTDVNAESEFDGTRLRLLFDTPLHNVLGNLRKGANNSDVIRQIRILLEARANPNQYNPFRGNSTAMEYFQSIRDRESRGRGEDRIFDNDCEEIEYALRNATLHEVQED